jgi:hypothetical protein
MASAKHVHNPELMPVLLQLVVEDFSELEQQHDVLVGGGLVVG